MDVTLSPELQTFVQNELQNGIYHDASEVISAGLRRLKHDQETLLPQFPGTREALEAALLASIERFDRGEGRDGEEVFRELRQLAADARSNG